MSTVTPVLLRQWYEDELVASLKAGIAWTFLVHGDISDLVVNPDREDEPHKPYIELREFWEKVLDGRPLVMVYNLATGLKFPNEAMKKQFKQLAGLESSSSGSAVDKAKAQLQEKRGIPREPEACLPLIEKVLQKSERAAVLVESVHLLAPAGMGGAALPQIERTNIERLRNWARDFTMQERGHLFLLLTDQAAKVSDELVKDASGVERVFIPRPDEAERRAYIESFTLGTAEHGQLLTQLTEADDKERENIEQQLARYPELFETPENFSVDAFARATQGMRLRQIRYVFLRAAQAGEALDLSIVKEEKRRILNEDYGDILEVLEPERGLDDIGGLEYIKKYMRSILDAVEVGEVRLIPQGITLMGPPGTGKTAIVESLAKEAGFNFVKTKNIRDMWVGQSEARMERLLYALRSLAPVVVMNDEADLAEAGRESPKGDSGVSERLMQKWMEFLSDPKIRGKILLISCTNRPDRIDAALKRSGRSDDRLLIPMPSLEEREAIFPVMLKRYSVPTRLKNYRQFAEATGGLSGADIERIALNSFRFAANRGEDLVDAEALHEAIADFIPSASQRDIDFMTLIALLESSSRRLLPPDIAEQIEVIKERDLVPGLDEYLQQLADRRILR